MFSRLFVPSWCILIFVLVACQSDRRATANTSPTAVAAIVEPSETATVTATLWPTKTASPSATATATPTPTATSTSTPTPTPSPTPTPVGGHGRLVFIDDYTILAINGNGSSLQTLTSRTEVMAALGVTDEDLAGLRYRTWDFSLDGSRFLYKSCREADDTNRGCSHDRLVIAMTDLSQVGEVYLSYPQNTVNQTWAKDSSRLLIDLLIDNPYAGHDVYLISAAANSFGDSQRLANGRARFWSGDEQRIYYIGSSGLRRMNLDGSNNVGIACDSCPPVYQARAGASAEDESFFLLGYSSVIYVADPEFTALEEIPYNPGNSGYQLRLSPDEHLAVAQSSFGFQIIDLATRQALEVRQPEGTIGSFCGWAPDQLTFFYIAIRWNADRSITEQLVVQDLAANKPRIIYSADRIISCPFWQS